VFGVLKKRFGILKVPPEFEYKTQVDLILALTGLHNFIRRQAQGQEDEFYASADRQREMELLLEDRGVVQEGSGLENVADDRIMKEFSDRIAENMWRDYVNYTGRR
jgi:hypothetical protein